jgi:hypothetical protein
MITLPHQFEFLSDGYLDEAQAFLRREQETRKADLGDKPFSVSERFDNAPPHLQLPNDVAEWQLHYDGDCFHVTRGFNANADLVSEGDYQAILSAVQLVDGMARSGAEHMERELAQLYGAGAVRSRGSLASKAQWQISSQAHGHLARRVVENPDLAHRAARQSVTAAIRGMEASGYVVLEGAISPGFADELRAATLAATDAVHASVLDGMLYRGRGFELLAQNAKLMTLIDASLGRGALLASFTAARFGEGDGAAPLHCDHVFIPEPHPEFALSVMAAWALEDRTLETGTIWVVPGSHKLRRAPRDGEPHGDAVPVLLRKGSVVLIAGGTWYWQTARTVTDEQVTLNTQFNRGILRSVEPEKRDVALLHRNSPRLGEMLGADDWFGKISDAGRDRVRFDYMLRLLEFNEQRKREILERSD